MIITLLNNSTVVAAFETFAITNEGQLPHALYEEIDFSRIEYNIIICSESQITVLKDIRGKNK